MIKVAITKDYLLKDYTEESFPHEDIIKYGFQEIELDDKYSNCKLEDFDFVNDSFYQFNAVKFSARITLERTKQYSELISNLIHKKYSIDDEIALINNKETRPVEYQDYQKYREQCKVDARRKLGM